MVKTFENKGYWAVVLGGSSGLGLASAQKLASEGMNICIVHRDPRAAMVQIKPEFEKMASITGFKSFNLDAALADNVDTIADALKSGFQDGDRVRLLLHSVARGTLKAATGPDQLSSDDLLITAGAMAFSLMYWTQALADAGLFADDARVLAFTSEGARRPIRGYAAVSAAKAALEALVRSIAIEFGPMGIRANCVQAGVTATRSMLAIPGSEAIIRHASKRNPLGRNTLPDDIAKVVYLLCRDEAAWINGTIICADGGESLQ